MAIEMNPAQGEVYSVAVVIADPSPFPEMRRGLLPMFRATLADTEQAIKEAVEDPTLQSMLFEMESGGQGARDGGAMAVGMARAERHLNAVYGDELVDHRTFVIAGDGDLMEGVNHEAVGLAGH